jgi:ATP-dependent exoDNAse (exonuclease V) alpha subunit
VVFDRSRFSGTPSPRLLQSPTSTLQRHLARGEQPDPGQKRFYVLDESSLALTRQIHEFFERLRPNDRVLLVGDRRQHEGVDAGRPFAQLQDAGMKTVTLEEIVRQKDPELKRVVEQLARGKVQDAIQNLARQGRVHQICGHDERIAAIAKEYAKQPTNTLVVSPDNRSRTEINERIHAELQGRGMVAKKEHDIRVLVPRQDLTGADRTWAARYDIKDVLRYSRASKETGIAKGAYAHVKGIDPASNRLTVTLQGGAERTYDPRRQRGVSVFRPEIRRFSVGHRIQFTAPVNDLKIANRELGAIEAIHRVGRLSLRMDSGRLLVIDPDKHPHLDYGYAMTSHSSQGQTAHRVLIHVDTELGAKDLLNNRMAYVSVSRGAFDAQLFTNDREKLPIALGHDFSKHSAHVPEINAEQSSTPHQEVSTEGQQEHGIDLGIGL